MTTRLTVGDPGSSDGIRLNFENILAHYTRARTSDVFGKAHSLWAEFDHVASLYRCDPTVTRFADISVRWSMGQGRWASVPWIAFLDKRWTTRTSGGVYVIYLFRADMTGVYITLNQGTEKLKAKFGTDSRTEIQARAERFRQKVTSLMSLGFSLNDRIETRSDLASVRAYEDSTIAHKFYGRGAVPVSEVLLADLGHALDAYEALILPM